MYNYIMNIISKYFNNYGYVLPSFDRQPAKIRAKVNRLRLKVKKLRSKVKRLRLKVKKSEFNVNKQV
jgi:hypothetical protein